MAGRFGSVPEAAEGVADAAAEVAERVPDSCADVTQAGAEIVERIAVGERRAEDGCTDEHHEPDDRDPNEETHAANVVVVAVP